jgi:hypothetical protein
MELFKNIGKMFGFRKTQKSRSKKSLMNDVTKFASKTASSLSPPSLKKSVKSIGRSIRKYKLK